MRLVDRMESRGIQKNQWTQEAILSGLASSKKWEMALSVFENIKSQGNFNPNPNPNPEPNPNPNPNNRDETVRSDVSQHCDGAREGWG